jgi:hypothetical protein
MNGVWTCMQSYYRSYDHQTCDRNHGAEGHATLVPEETDRRGNTEPMARGEISYAFRPYRQGRTLAPVTVVTPPDDTGRTQAGGFIHTFFDVCPFSPSQRFLAVTRLPYGNRRPMFGDRADVCVIDLERETIRRVYETLAWELQLGANVQWGATDRFLYTNDVIDGRGTGVRIDLESGDATILAGPLYHVGPAETDIIGVSFDMLDLRQRGYGIPRALPVDRRSIDSVSETEGLWRTRLDTNTASLLVSVGRLVRSIGFEVPDHATAYPFHAKYNRDGSRIMQVVRVLHHEMKSRGAEKRFGRLAATFDAGGECIACAVPYERWSRGGHHPNWHPDGEHIVMNLMSDDDTLRFCQIRCDGTDFRVLSTRHRGGGHPSVNGKATFLLTDAYQGERRFLPGGSSWPPNEVPIRLLDLRSDEEASLCTVDTLGISGRFRVDPHPVWSRDYRRLCFNGMVNGARAVFVADVSAVIRD